MDAVGIRSRILSLRSLCVPTLAGLSALAGSACAKPVHDDYPVRTAAHEGALTGEPDERATPPSFASNSTGDITHLQRAIRLYAADRAGRLPVRLEDLVKETSPEGDRYLTRLPVDPWGRPYAYAVVSARLGAYDLRSYGPDTLPGTADDLVADAQLVPVH